MGGGGGGCSFDRRARQCADGGVPISDCLPPPPACLPACLWVDGRLSRARPDASPPPCPLSRVQLAAFGPRGLLRPFSIQMYCRRCRRRCPLSASSAYERRIPKRALLRWREEISQRMKERADGRGRERESTLPIEPKFDKRKNGYSSEGGRRILSSQSDIATNHLPLSFLLDPSSPSALSLLHRFSCKQGSTSSIEPRKILPIFHLYIPDT